MYDKIKNLILHFADDSLYRNSIYLMLSTGVMAFFGFLFWVINTRLYTPEQVGLATTIISVTSLITGISMLGFNNAIIKYLPKAKNEKLIINTSFMIVLFISCSVSIIYLFGIQIFSPSLLFINQNIVYSIGFVVIMVISAINSLSDSVFIAKRETIYIFIYYSLMNFVKILLPFQLIFLGAIGIYLSTFGGIFTSFVLTFIFLYWKFNYTFTFDINLNVAKKMFAFSSKNYLANFINGLPALLLPIIITNKLGPKFTAYFYIAMMITNIIYIIPSAITNSFFAEGVYDEYNIKNLVLKTLKITILFLIPAILITVLFGKYILLAFGKQFSDETFSLMRILVLTGLLLPINSIGSTILNIKGKLNVLIFICSVNAITILGSLYFISSYTLITIGYVWLISHIIVAFLTIFILYKYILK